MHMFVFYLEWYFGGKDQIPEKKEKHEQNHFLK